MKRLLTLMLILSSLAQAEDEGRDHSKGIFREPAVLDSLIQRRATLAEPRQVSEEPDPAEWTTSGTCNLNADGSVSCHYVNKTSKEEIIWVHSPSDEKGTTESVDELSSDAKDPFPIVTKTADFLERLSGSKRYPPEDKKKKVIVYISDLKGCPPCRQNAAYILEFFKEHGDTHKMFYYPIGHYRPSKGPDGKTYPPLKECVDYLESMIDPKKGMPNGRLYSYRPDQKKWTADPYSPGGIVSYMKGMLSPEATKRAQERNKTTEGTAAAAEELRALING